MSQHSHDHAHQHSHAHGHHHRHAPHAAAPSRADRSLLRASAAGRLGLAAVAIAAVWGGVIWAMS